MSTPKRPGDDVADSEKTLFDWCKEGNVDQLSSRLLPDTNVNGKDNMVSQIRECVLSSSRTSVQVKLGLFNAKIRNENHRYIHRLIYQLNEQDVLCHSI